MHKLKLKNAINIQNVYKQIIYADVSLKKMKNLIKQMVNSNLGTEILVRPIY